MVQVTTQSPAPPPTKKVSFLFHLLNVDYVFPNLGSGHLELKSPLQAWTAWTEIEKSVFVNAFQDTQILPLPASDKWQKKFYH